MMMSFSAGRDLHYVLLFSKTGECSLVAGLPVTLTFLVTVILFSLGAVLVGMFVRVHRRKIKSAPPGPVSLFEIPYSVGCDKESIKMSTDIVYGHAQPQSTTDVHIYDNVAL